MARSGLAPNSWLGTRDSGLLRLLNITADHNNHPSVHRGSHDSYADLRRFNRRQSFSLVERASNYCLSVPTVPVLFRPTGVPKPPIPSARQTPKFYRNLHIPQCLPVSSRIAFALLSSLGGRKMSRAFLPGATSVPLTTVTTTILLPDTFSVSSRARNM